MDKNGDLKKLIGKDVTITYSNDSGDAYTSGVLKGVTDDKITLTVFNPWGKPREYNLNRNACTLLNWIVEPE